MAHYPTQASYAGRSGHPRPFRPVAVLRASRAVRQANQARYSGHEDARYGPTSGPTGLGSRYEARRPVAGILGPSTGLGSGLVARRSGLAAYGPRFGPGHQAHTDLHLNSRSGGNSIPLGGIMQEYDFQGKPGVCSPGAPGCSPGRTGHSLHRRNPGDSGRPKVSELAVPEVGAESVVPNSR